MTTTRSHPSARSTKRKPAHDPERTFFYRNCAAQEVLLVGDFTGWMRNAVAMQRGPDGVWQAVLRLPPGRHEYRFLVDGTWSNAADDAEQVRNPYGSVNSVCLVT